MSEELKPCPFCGGAAQLEVRGKLEGCVFVRCDSCFQELQYAYAGSALRKWNTRPVEDALRARIAELEAIIAKAKTKEPMAWLDKHGIPSKIPTWGSKALYLNPFPEDGE